MAAGDTPEFPRCSRAHEKVSRNRQGGFALVASEPFRVFFPLGILVGVYGVSLWPMVYAEWLWFPPGIPHARLMVAGFLGAFVIGFLGTALPRMLSAPKIRIWELSGYLVLYGAFVFCAGTGRVLSGDIFSLSLILSFFVAMGIRWLLMRKEHPPAEFGVAVLGVGCAALGMAFQIAGAKVEMSPFWVRISSLLIYQGFTLLPILGIGGFLAPRLLGSDGNGTRKRNVGSVWLAAMAVLISMGVEAWGNPRLADGMRFSVVLAYFALRTDVFSRTGTRGSLPFAFRVSVWSLLASFACGVIRPDLRIGVEHIAFVSGIGLMALTVGSRVVLGHSGNGRFFFARNRPMQWMVGLALLAMTTRVSADFFPDIRKSHYIYAAALWAILALIWSIWLVPKLMQRDPEEG